MSRASSSVPSRTDPVRSRATRGDSFNRKVLRGWWDSVRIPAREYEVPVPPFVGLTMRGDDLWAFVRPVRDGWTAMRFASDHRRDHIAPADMPSCPRFLASLILPRPDAADLESVRASMNPELTVVGPRFPDDRTWNLPPALMGDCVIDCARFVTFVPVAIDEFRAQAASVVATMDVLGA